MMFDCGTMSPSAVAVFLIHHHLELGRRLEGNLVGLRTLQNLIT
jgi:hypothetical protein